VPSYPDSQDNIITADQPAFNEATGVEANFVQRTFKITYSHSFGNDKLGASRERTTGAEEEKGRVQ
jgi:hypothetical protein